MDDLLFIQKQRFVMRREKTDTHCIDDTSYTPGIRSMWRYIVFAFPFVRSSVRSYVRSFVRSYVRSFVFPSQGQFLR